MKKSKRIEKKNLNRWLKANRLAIKRGMLPDLMYFQYLQMEMRRKEVSFFQILTTFVVDEMEKTKTEERISQEADSLVSVVKQQRMKDGK